MLELRKFERDSPKLRKLEGDSPKQALYVGTKKSTMGREKMTINGRRR